MFGKAYKFDETMCETRSSPEARWNTLYKSVGLNLANAEDETLNQLVCIEYIPWIIGGAASDTIVGPYNQQHS